MFQIFRITSLRNVVTAAIEKAWRVGAHRVGDVEEGQRETSTSSMVSDDDKEPKNALQVPQYLLDATQRLWSSKHIIEKLEAALEPGHRNDDCAGNQYLLQRRRDEQLAYKRCQEEVERNLIRFLTTENLLDPKNLTVTVQNTLDKILEAQACQNKLMIEAQACQNKLMVEARAEFDQRVHEIADQWKALVSKIELLQDPGHFDEMWNEFWFVSTARGEAPDVVALSNKFQAMQDQELTALRLRKVEIKKEFQETLQQIASRNMPTNEYLFVVPEEMFYADNEEENSDGSDYEEENERPEFGGDHLTPAEDWDAKKNRLATWVGNLPHVEDPSPNGYLQLEDIRTMAPSDDERQNFQPPDNIIDRDIVWNKAGLIFGRQSREQPRSLSEAMATFSINIAPTREARVPGPGVLEEVEAVAGADDETSLDSRVVEVYGDS